MMNAICRTPQSLLQGRPLMPAPQNEEMTQLGLYGVIPFIVAAVALWLSPLLIPQHIALDFISSRWFMAALSPSICQALALAQGWLQMQIMRAVSCLASWSRLQRLLSFFRAAHFSFRSAPHGAIWSYC